jgi:hypothetical protein
MENMLTAYQWLCLAGVPGIIGGIIGGVIAKVKSNKSKDEALYYGIQALMRCQLRAMYEEHKDMRYASIDAKDDFENLYKWYHALGKNGVMDDVRERFMALPTDPPEIQNGGE